ncbi:hypothetical protein ES703_53095 [subsurface metagenome]
MKLGNIKGAGVQEQEQYCGQETKVAKPGNDESLFGGVGCCRAVEPETNEEIGA